MLQLQNRNLDGPVRVCSQRSYQENQRRKVQAGSGRNPKWTADPPERCDPPGSQNPHNEHISPKSTPTSCRSWYRAHLESALPVALLVRAEQLLRTHDEAGDDPTMALTRARHLPARDLKLRQSAPGSGPEDA